jgi:hypothetical protein
VLVGVDRLGDAMVPANLLQPQEIAGGIFFFPEDCSGDQVVGIVNHTDQGQPGATPFQPIVAATVCL